MSGAVDSRGVGLGATPAENRYLRGLGRLRAGGTLDQAQTELDTISARLEAAYPPTNRGWRSAWSRSPTTSWATPGGGSAVARSGRPRHARRVRKRRKLFLAHAAAASAKLPCDRPSARLAATCPAGAHRERPSVVDAGVLGIPIARWGLNVLIAIGAAAFPGWSWHRSIASPLVLGRGVVATGVLFGVLPALSISRVTLVQALREGTRGTGTRHRTRKVLVVAEVAMALVAARRGGVSWPAAFAVSSRSTSGSIRAMC